MYETNDLRVDGVHYEQYAVSLRSVSYYLYNASFESDSLGMEEWNDILTHDEKRCMGKTG